MATVLGSYLHLFDVSVNKYLIHLGPLLRWRWWWLWLPASLSSTARLRSAAGLPATSCLLSFPIVIVSKKLSFQALCVFWIKNISSSSSLGFDDGVKNEVVFQTFSKPWKMVTLCFSSQNKISYVQVCAPAGYGGYGGGGYASYGGYQGGGGSYAAPPPPPSYQVRINASRVVIKCLGTRWLRRIPM